MVLFSDYHDAIDEIIRIKTELRQLIRLFNRNDIEIPDNIMSELQMDELPFD